MTPGGVYDGHVLNSDLTPQTKCWKISNSLTIFVQNFRENILEIFKKIIDNYEWQVLSLAQG